MSAELDHHDTRITVSTRTYVTPLVQREAADQFAEVILGTTSDMGHHLRLPSLGGSHSHSPRHHPHEHSPMCIHPSWAQDGS